jgi:N-acetylglucosaminyldiphosphoundecaprenol N-acetyl-beta-D-mannosaminyltransferase
MNSEQEIVTATSVLGVHIDAINFAYALARAEELIESGESHYIVTPNPEIVLHAHRDALFRAILNNASLSLCDGVGLFLAANLKGYALPSRICGADFMEALCAKAEKRGWHITLVGAKQEIRRLALRVLRTRYPALALSETSGEGAIPNCDIAFVALGAPKQELWIHEQRQNGSKVKLFMPVGGTFDMLAGVLPRAPFFLRSFGLEWLWRLFLEPSRAGRIFQAVILFPCIFLLTVAKEKFLSHR